MTRLIPVPQLTSKPEKTVQWQMIINWVDHNLALVRHIAEPYKHYMASGNEDLRHEAYLAGIEALSAMYKAGLPMDTNQPGFGAYFRVKMKNRCISLSKVGAPSQFKIENSPGTLPDDIFERYEDEAERRRLALRQARLLPGKQREIAQYILTADRPVSNADIAKKFKICDRYVRQVLAWSAATISARAKIYYPGVVK